MSHDDLVGMYYDNGKNALRAAVQSAFNDHVFIYCDFLRPTNLPEEILHSILPFLYGADLSEVVIGEIVSTVKKLEAAQPNSPNSSIIPSCTFTFGRKKKKLPTPPSVKALLKKNWQCLGILLFIDFIVMFTNIELENIVEKSSY